MKGGYSAERMAASRVRFAVDGLVEQKVANLVELMAAWRVEHSGCLKVDYWAALMVGRLENHAVDNLVASKAGSKGDAWVG